MELEELGDKNDVEVEVLAKHPNIPSHQRFPKDEAVLARFGKQQQFRVSQPLSVLQFHVHSLRQPRRLKRSGR